MSHELVAQWATIVGRASSAEAEASPDPAEDAGGAAAVAGHDLLARWAEPHRRYHGLDHLGAVLARIDDLASVADPGGADLDVVRLAAFFHDAVYDVRSTDNEARSAELAARVLSTLGVGDDRVREVARLVRLTSTHLPQSEDDVAGAILCDADLAILAAAPEPYATYAAAVREEYAHVPDEAFLLGRSQVLTALLDRPWLFHTAPGRARWEQVARHNVANELLLLSSSRRQDGAAAGPLRGGA